MVDLRRFEEVNRRVTAERGEAPIVEPLLLGRLAVDGQLPYGGVVPGDDVLTIAAINRKFDHFAV